ncbi:MAG TPA: MerR family transcriptional regulator, partial [Marinobacter hydrocarbonoclasticus]|nr:MerR family transcriptional regulator [Marinobacter nauticus]
ARIAELTEVSELLKQEQSRLEASAREHGLV